MEEQNKHSLLLKYGPRELEIFNRIEKGLREKTNDPDNRNEIIRRSLHAFQYLVQTDNTLTLKALSAGLRALREHYDENLFEFSKSLALFIYSDMICKSGISESELFESIVSNMQSIQDYKKTYPLDSISGFNKMLDYMANSIDLIFLRNADLSSSLNLLSLYYSRSDQVSQNTRPLSDNVRLEFPEESLFSISYIPFKSRSTNDKEQEQVPANTRIIVKKIQK